MAALGNSEALVRNAAVEALKNKHSIALEEVALEASNAFLNRGTGKPFDSLMQSLLAEIIRDIAHPSSQYLERLSKLLDWYYWEVRMKAAQALGNISRNIPPKLSSI